MRTQVLEENKKMELYTKLGILNRESQLITHNDLRNIRKLQNFVESDFLYHDTGGQRVKEPVIDKGNSPIGTLDDKRLFYSFSPLIPAKAPDTKKGIK